MTAGDDPDQQALEFLRGRITGIDAQVSHLLTERQSLVDEYERHRLAIIGRLQPVPASPPAPVAAAGQEWSGARVRGLLLGLGAALLAISALTFTAVAWSRLGPSGRAVLLLGATAVVTGLALALRRRLPATAEAFAGLAVILMLVDVYAARRAGLGDGIPWELWWSFGTALTAGFAALLGLAVGRRATRFAVALLLPVAAQLLVLRTTDTWQGSLILAILSAAIVWGVFCWGAYFYREGQVVLGLHAGASWLGAAGLAAVAASEPTTVAGAVPAAVAVAALGAAPELARRRLIDPPLRTGAATLAAGVPAGIALTLVGPVLGPDGVRTAAVVAGAATLLAAMFLSGVARTGALIAGAAFALPGTLWAVGAAAPAVYGPAWWLLDAWTGTLGQGARAGSPAWPGLDGSWAAVTTLAIVGAVGVILGIRRPALFGITSGAIGFIAALMPVAAGGSVLVTLAVTLAAAILISLAAARWGWALLPGAVVAAVPAAGWAAVSAAASVVTLALSTVAAAGAALIARNPAVRTGFAGLAGLLAVAFTGVATRAAGAAVPAAGLAAAVAAGLVALFGIYLLRHQPQVDTVMQGVGALAAGVALVAASGSTPWLAGALTALVPLAAFAALRSRQRALYGTAAAALALAAVWAWLSAARVTVIEAYTAPAALAALAAGILQWRIRTQRGPGRSWLTLGPALLLAIGPTLLLGMEDDNLVRLIVAAMLSLAAVVAGAVWRLQAPLCLGAAALLALAIDQWGEEIVRMPRWITVGIVGVLLMWIGATFEARRRDWTRASEVFGRFG